MAHGGAPLRTQTLLAIDATPPPADGAASFVLRTWADSQGDVLKPTVAQPMLAGLIAIVGTVWLALAGLVVSQATGMTDISPMSGMALIGVPLLFFLTAALYRRRYA